MNSASGVILAERGAINMCNGTQCLGFPPDSRREKNVGEMKRAFFCCELRKNRKLFYGVL